MDILEEKQKSGETGLCAEIIEIFKNSRNNYGTRKIMKELTETENILNRQFHERGYRDVAISGLTYVRAGAHWNYICVPAGLYNREIIGYSAGKHKTAGLVKEAFQSVEGSLEDIRLSHTDRGNEFKNKTVGELLETFHIERFLSHKGCPYNNAAEATFKTIKQNSYGMKHLQIYWN